MNPLAYLIKEGFAALFYWYELDHEGAEVDQNGEVSVSMELVHFKSAGITNIINTGNSYKVIIRGMCYEIDLDFIKKYGYRSADDNHAKTLGAEWKKESALVAREFESIAMAIK